MTTAHAPFADPRQNQLLAALPPAQWPQWQALLEPVNLQRGQVLGESGRTPAHVYFPVTAVVSLLVLTLEGEATEVAVVGHDGVVGISLFMGGSAMPSQAVVQADGTAYRLRAAALMGAVEHGGAVLETLLRYTQALMAQVAQTALCNRYHSISQQFSRRLLQGLDRAPCDDLQMTQESAAQLLGVRREGVTAAALKLQRSGVISYRRGHIAVLDRSALERHTCTCYGATKREYQRLMPRAMALAA